MSQASGWPKVPLITEKQENTMSSYKNVLMIYRSLIK
jgi:hypothetical protein